MSRSPSFVSSRLAERTSPTSGPIESANATARNFPSGQEEIRLRAPSSATSSILRNSPTTKSGPSRSASSTTRRRARSAAVARAVMSVVTICGARIPKALKTSSQSFEIRKFWPTRTGGRFRPSMKREVAETG